MAIKVQGTTVIDDSRQLSVTGISTLGSIKVDSGIVTSVSGVVTYYGDASNLTDLTGAGVGTYGSNNVAPIITVDANGRITGITTAAITGTDAIASVSEDTEPQLGGNLDLNSKLINGTGGINITGVATATAFHTGAEGSAVRITSDTISGPAELFIDPAAVGDDTGAVRIKGDLYVDGTTTQINSTTIELADFIVGIATTATTDSLADGAGITIGPNNTFLYDHSNTSLKSSENLNLATGKTYKINGTDVLSATTLGSAVVNSSLTSVGTLTELNVTGIVTASSFSGDLTGTATYASYVDLTANNTTDDTFYLTFADGATGTQRLETDTDLTYNPSTNFLNTQVSRSSNTYGLTVSAVSTNSNYFVPFTSLTASPSGNTDSDIYVDAGLRYNPSTNTLDTKSTSSSTTFGLTVSAVSTDNNFLVPFTSLTATGSGNQESDIYIDSGLKYNPSTNILDTTSTRSQNTYGITVSAVSADSNYLVPFTSLTVSPSGNTDSDIYVDAGLRYNPLDNVLHTTATDAQVATNVTLTANNSNNETCYIPFADGSTGTQGLETDTGLTYNPSTNTVTATTFSGNIEVSTDTTPQLGGNLDVNAKNINFGNSGSASDDRLNFGAGTDFSIYHNGTNSYIDVIPDATNHLYIRNNVGSDYNGNIYLQAKSGEDSIICADDSSVELYFDNTWKVATTSTGFTVNGTGLGNWKVNDSNYLTAGTGDDFQIYHNGTHTYLDNDTGNLYIRNNVAADVNGDIYIQAKSGETSILCADDSGVDIYFDNEWRISTSATGFSVNGVGIGTWKATDNRHLIAGTGDDFKIYHNGTNTYLDNDTGHLYIRNSGSNDDSNVYIQARDGEDSIICADDGAVELYHDNAWRLATSATGISVNGIAAASGLNVTGIATATSFSGSASNMTGLTGASAATYGSSDVAPVITVDANGRITGITTAAISGSGAIASISEDTDPQLGGDLDLNSKLIDGTGGINITGIITATTFSGSGASLTSIPNSALDNSSVNFGGVTVALGATDLTPAFDLQDATNYPYTSLTGISTNIAGDTTPQLGGTLETNGNLIKFGDSSGATDDRLMFGADNDLQIYHTGSISYISDQGTGALRILGNAVKIRNAADNEQIANFTQNGSVELYHDNSLKFETTGIGVSIVGTGNTATITGPSELVLDPAAVGDNTGKVVILGNLQVDGTQTVINSTTLTVDDKSIVVASGATDSSAANGAGIEVDGASATFQYAHSGTKWVANKDLQAEAFIKNGGTSSQFLKADGSVDSSTYLTSESDTLDSVTGRGSTTTNNIDVGEVTADGLNISGISTLTNQAEVRSDDGSQGRIDFYCEVSNAHYTRLQAAAHADYSGNATVTLPTSSGTLLLTNGSGANLTSLNASNLGSGTVPDARFPSTLPAVSAANLTNLTGVGVGTYGSASLTPIITVDSNGRITAISTVTSTGSGGISSVSQDTSPQLGGNLDLNSKLINGTGGINITGVATATGFATATGTSSQFLKADGSVDSSTYLTTETNDLSSAVTWANVPNANITESSVTQHQAALSITESQISDLQSYLTTETQTLDDVVGLGSATTQTITVGTATTGVVIRPDGTLNVSGVSTFQSDIVASSTLTLGNASGITGGAPADEGVLSVYGRGKNALIIQTDSNTDSRGVAFRNSGDAYIGYISIENVGSNLGDMVFGVSDTTENSVANVDERVRFTKDGDVGIGTNSPTTKLDVRGGLNVTGVSTFQGNLQLGDNDILNIGDGNDLRIYHTGSHSYIDDNGTGNLYLRSGTLSIQNLAGSKTSAVFNSGSSQELYYDNSKKFETTGAGVTITGISTATVLYGTGGTYADAIDTVTDAALIIGRNAAIYTDDGSYLRVLIEKQDDVINIGQQNTAIIDGIELKPGTTGGRVKLHAGGTSDNVKLETTNAGVTITGIATATSFSGSASNMTGLTGASAATYGSTGATPVITVDANGRITGITTVTTSGSGGGLAQVSDDTNPQLGGDLDLNSKLIDGTGGINITGIVTATSFSGNIISESSVPNSALVNTTIYLGGVNIALGATDATPAFDLQDATNYPYTSLTGISTNIVGDTTPQLGGDLDLNANLINGTGGINISGVVTATTFSGSAASLTSIPAGQLTGTVADARLSTVSSSKLSGALPALDGSALTDLTGASAATYGSANATPVIVVDSNGRITGISTVATAGSGSGSGISSVSEDTTPQLGGTLETNGNLIQFGDSSGATDDRLRFGAGNDLQIWHNGANSYVSQQSDVGDLYLVSLNDDNDVIIQTDSGDGNTTDYFRADGSTGEAKLFYYGSEKIKTVNTGVTITGTASATEFSGGGSNLTGLTGASAATYGSSTVTPIITVDSNGRITGITTATTAGGGGGGSGTVSGVSSDGEIVGTGVTAINFVGTGITVSINGSTADITIPTSDKNVHREVATEGQTVVPASGTIEYTVGHCDVYLNGSKLDSTEYTATNGTSITLTTGASVGDVIEVIGFQIGVELNLVGLSDVVDDTSPQLGGPLDLNSRTIQGQGSINVTGIVSATTFSGSGASLTGIPNSALDNSSISVGGVTFNLGGTDTTPAFNLSDATNYPYTSLTGISTNILGDTTPQLGGNLDLNSKLINGTGGINITGVVTATSFAGNITGDVTGDVTGTADNATNVTVADESSDTTCFPLFVTAATGDLPPKSGSNLTFDSSAGILGATTFQGNLDVAGLLKEGVNITAGKLSGNTNIDLANGMVHLFTTTETATSTPNIRVDASTTLDSSMSTGESVTVVLISAAAAAGYSAQLTIDGSAVTESWLGGSAPSEGGASGYDVYTYNIIKTGSATFVVLANLVNFA